MVEPVFESAVTKTYAPVDDAAVELIDESAATKTLVRSDRPQLGVEFGTSGVAAGAMVCGTRPDEWLLIGGDEQVRAAEELIDTGGFTSVIPFTHGRSMFRLVGAPTASVVEKVCGLDLSDTMTPDGAVVSASVALVTCDIVRNDVDGVRSYLLMCDRSFGQYLFDALLDAGTEFTITVARPT